MNRRGQDFSSVCSAMRTPPPAHAVALKRVTILPRHLCLKHLIQPMPHQSPCSDVSLRRPSCPLRCILSTLRCSSPFSCHHSWGSSSHNPCPSRCLTFLLPSLLVFRSHHLRLLPPTRHHSNHPTPILSALLAYPATHPTSVPPFLTSHRHSRSLLRSMQPLLKYAALPLRRSSPPRRLGPASSSQPRPVPCGHKKVPKSWPSGNKSRRCSYNSKPRQTVQRHVRPPWSHLATSHAVPIPFHPRMGAALTPKRSMRRWAAKDLAGHPPH